jgi:hypothetical protein
MHGTNFLIDLDTGHTGDIADSVSLDLGILNGVQLNPLATPGFKTKANRLLIFTGTAVCAAAGFPDNDEIRRGVVRIRLGYHLGPTREFHGSAAFASLAFIFGEDSQDASLFAVDMASVVTKPVDGPLPQNNLPDNELYLLLDVAVGESGSRVHRIGYQANVLVLESDPDILSIMVSTDGVLYSTSRAITPGSHWWFQIVVTGPVPQGQTFTIGMQSSDSVDIPTSPHSFIHGDGITFTYEFYGGTVAAAPRPQAVTITALGKHVQKQATLIIETVK